MDDALRRRVRELGGISAMAISHPHFYGSMIEWAHAFDAPVYIHEADRRWTARPDDAIVYWQGDTREIGDGLTLINAGVHFAGGQVLQRSGGRRSGGGGGAVGAGAGAGRERAAWARVGRAGAAGAGAGPARAGMAGAGLARAGLAGAGLVRAGLAGAGLAGTGLVRTGLAGAGLVSTGLAG